MTWQEKQIQGKANILKHLSGEGEHAVSFKSIIHTPDSFDIQPSVSGGIIVFVNGHVRVDGDQQQLRYSEFFHLIPGNDFPVITNNIFRLMFG